MDEYTAADKEAAKKLRADYLHRYIREPVFDSTRRTFDRAERAYDVATDVAPLSVRQRMAQRKQRLRANLDSVRNHNVQYFYQETMPTAPGEVTFRALISTDVVNSAINMGKPKTCVTVDLHPHNDASFKLRREPFIGGLRIPPPPAGDDEEAAAKNKNKVGDINDIAGVIKIKILASDGASTKEINELIDFARKFTDKAPIAISLGIEAGPAADPKQRPPRYIVANIFHHGTLDGGEEDPLGMFIRDMLKSFLGRTATRELLKEDGDGIPALLRMGQVRLEMMQSFGEWLTEHGCGAMEKDCSIATLFEGMRASVELIAKDQFTRLMADEMAQTCIGSSVADCEVERLVTTVAANLSRDTTLHLRVTPPELLAAASVKSLAEAWRKATVRENEDDDNKSGGSSEKEKEEMRLALSTTMPEEAIASLLFQKTKLGWSAHAIRRALLKPLIDIVNEDDAERMELVSEGLRQLRTVFGALKSVSVLTPSGEIKAKNITGIDGKLLDWLPEDFDISPESLSALVRPYVLAGTEEEGGDIDKIKVGTAMSTSGGADAPQWSCTPLLSSLTKEIADCTVIKARNSKCDRLVQFPSQRTAAAAAAAARDGAAAGPPNSAWDFPPAASETLADARDWLETGFSELKSKVEDLEARARGEARALPVRTQVEKAVGGSTVKCSKCGASYNPSIPTEAFHNCDDRPMSEEVVVRSGVRRPSGGERALAQRSEKDEIIGRNSLPPEKPQQVAVIGSTASRPVAPAVAARSEKDEIIGRNSLPPEKPQHVAVIGSTASRPVAPALAARSEKNEIIGRNSLPPEKPQQVAVIGSTASRPIAASPPRTAQPTGTNSPRPASSGRSTVVVATSPRPDQQRDRLFTRVGGFTIPTDEQSLRAIFETFDLDKNGKISLDEFSTEYAAFEASMGLVLKPQDVKAAFRTADSNSDGALTYREFSIFMLARAAKG